MAIPNPEQASDIQALHVAALADPVKYLAVPAEDAATGALWGLYFALYYSKWEWWRDAPDSVVNAYCRVQALVTDQPHSD